MRKVHRAGDTTEIDYSGMTVSYQDRKTGQVHEAQIFVGSLSASSYIYTEPTPSQGEEDFLASQGRMFSAFGGVSRSVIPDNLKSAVTHPDRYEPVIPRIYLEFAKYYGVAILPARVRRPQDKADAESGVMQVERWVLAPLRKCVFFSIEDIRLAMAPLVKELNDRPLTGLDVSRRDLFERLDRPALRPLPPEPFTFATWYPKQAVGRDYHVRLDGRLYSVPSFLFGESIEIRATDRVVEVFHRGERVASHMRLIDTDAGRVSTQVAHMPPHHRAQAELSEWDQGRFLRWAETFGPHTLALIQGVFERRDRPEQAYGTCQGVLHAASRAPVDRVEIASKQCVEGGAFTARAFRSTLKELAAKVPDVSDTPPIVHENVRGPGYYGGK